MRLYSELAEWWPLLDDPADYAEEAGVYGDLLAEACDAPIESLLELGSGGGNTASHLKQHFRRLVLTHLSEDMLAVSRALNPECEHRAGDMRTLRLGTDVRRGLRPRRRLLHDDGGGPAPRCGDRVGALPARRCGAVRAGLRARELPGGGDDGWLRRAAAPRELAGECPRGLRYLEWVWDPDPRDTEYLVDFAFLLRERDGSVRAVQDRHVEGLFARDRWLDLLASVGFEARSVPLVLSDVESGRHEMFAGRRPR